MRRLLNALGCLLVLAILLLALMLPAGVLMLACWLWLRGRKPVRPRSVAPLLVLLPALAWSAGTPGRTARSSAVVRAFRAAYPPPAWCLTGGKYDPKLCETDHAIPLCAGGPDAIWNLHYQRRADAAKKDRLEGELCRRLTRCGP